VVERVGGFGSGGKRPGAGRRVISPEMIEEIAYRKEKGILRARTEAGLIRPPATPKSEAEIRRENQRSIDAMAGRISPEEFVLDDD
jgi:hypothetical protein